MQGTLQSRLASLSGQGLLRDDRADQRRLAAAAAGELGRQLLDFSGNDYLGFAARESPPELAQGTADGFGQVGWGAGASRLVHGTRPEHSEFEAAFADWLGYEAALLFSSGYAANLGVLSALSAPGDRVISDALNHASIVDGARLGRGERVVVPHGDLAAVEAALQAPCAGQRWVVVESYYSMDGDSPDLPTLRALTSRFDAALIVDEAHALGVFGAEGRGLCAERGVRPDVLVGAFGKAFGLQGAAVAGSRELRTLLWNRARSFVYSTAPSPRLVSELSRRLDRLRGANEQRERVNGLSTRLRELLTEAGGVSVSGERGPIVPCVLGPSDRAVRVASRLISRGILVQAIRPPTVPEGTARLRLTVNAEHREADLLLLTSELQRVLCEES